MLGDEVITLLHKTSRLFFKQTAALTVIILLPMIQTTPLFTTPQTPPSRHLRWVAGGARLLLWLTITVWMLFGASWGVLHGWIVPRIGEFRPHLEIQASKVLGVTVQIGQITAQSNGLIPSFDLRDIVLFDPQGRQAVRLPHLLAVLSPSSLWGMGFEQLFIDQPVLEVRRSADGKIYLGGLDITTNQDDGHAIADWIFSQTELSIKGGTIRWTDELRQAPPLVLTQVDGMLRNGRRRHLMRLDATPPPEWGERFNLRGIFRQPLLSADANQWRAWTGQLYAELGRVDVSRIQQYVSVDTLGIDLKAGNGSVRAWADVRKGQLVGATFDVALTDVNTQLGHALEPLALATATGRFSGNRLENGFLFSTKGLHFTTPDGLNWPGGNLELLHTGTPEDPVQKNELKADKLDLTALTQIASRLPLGVATHNLITSYAPKGLVDDVTARWQVPSSGPVSFAARGRVTGFEVAARPNSGVAQTAPASPGSLPVLHELPGRPGVSGATIDFDVTHTGGKATVKIAQGSLDLPGVFEDPHVSMDQLSMDAQWTLLNGEIKAQLRNIKFSNKDAEGMAQAEWKLEAPSKGQTSAKTKPADESLGILNLQGSLSRGDGTKVHRYLPLVLPQQVRHYVRDAVVQGQISDVKFMVNGPVNEIPFANPGHGDFKVSAKIRNGVFAYVPPSLQPKEAKPWPTLTQVKGEMAFNRAALEITGISAAFASQGGLQVLKADARIPNLLHSATVDLTASLKGPLVDALGFINSSPVGDMIGAALSKAVGSGSADYGVRLHLPLFALDKTQIQGSVSLAGNDVQFTPASPLLGRLKGVLTFSETGFNVAGAQARVMGGDLRFEGGMRAPSRSAAIGTELEAPISFRGQGTVTAEGLRQAKEMDFVARLAQNASGSAAYAATLAFRRGAAELVVSSNLQGLAFGLPAPLDKSADSVLPLRFENTLVRDSLAPGQKLQDQLILTMGRIASIVYIRDVSGGEAKVMRGAIGVGLEPGESAPLPDQGVAANINLAKIDVGAWDRALSGPPAQTTTKTIAAGKAITGSARDSTLNQSNFSASALSYLPTKMAIRANELNIQGHKLNHVVVGGSREGPNWRANIDATELNGYVEFRQPGGNAGAGRVYARLTRLILATSTASSVENILEEQPLNIPALDIVVDDLELRGKKLGRVEIDAVNRGPLSGAPESGPREWRLNKFNITVPEAVLTATGNWVAVKALASTSVFDRRRTVMSFKLDILDSGELLKRFGMKDVIRRGKGKMEGQVAWVGSPLSLDYPSMSGQFNVNIEAGQFLKADPGIAKLLGVLSLQALPRRLTLDFRDVFSEGFAFDFVRGDVNILQGLAATNNLQMKGVAAAVLMDGSADIAKETQDIKVVVVPEINAGTASLIATVINPAIGLGSFLAQYFLRRPLIQATTQEFHISGNWTDPKITKVEHK